MRGPRVGDVAPDFELAGSDGRTWRLSELRGHPVVLAFYPADESPVCTRQMCSYSEHWDDLTQMGMIVLGISAQDLASHARFVQRFDLKVPLLADPERTTISAYGADGPFGLTKRATYLVDEEGVVRWKHSDPGGLTYRKPEDLFRQVRQLPRAG